MSGTLEEMKAEKKFRVYEVAREVNLSSEALVALLKGLGYDIRSHMSVVSPEMRVQVDEKFASERGSALQEMKRKAEQLEDRKRREEAQAKAQAQAQAEAEAQARAQAKAQIQAQAQAQPPAQTKASPQAPVPPPAQAAAEGAEGEGDGKKRRRRRRRRRGRGGAVIGDPVAPTEAPPPGTEIEERFETVTDRALVGQRRRVKPAKGRRRTVDQRVVEENVRKTMAQMEVGVRQRRRRFRDVRQEATDSTEEIKVIRASEFVTVSELAGLMEVRPTDVIMKLFSMGSVVTINQRLDMDTIHLVADEFGFEVEPVEDLVEDILSQEEVEEPPESLVHRPPIVTIMGHVDHGKTSLLDYIRKSNVIAGEAGGITQHIGAYEVTLPGGRQITFLDTPGHEAFTAMRARGAQVTDVVVLVVAADDNVMPQTVEAIDHARAAEVPIVVGINKVDLPTADPAKIKRQLAEHKVLVEEWGGDVVASEISAKTGLNVDHFLELLALQTEVLELKANPNKRARGVAVEAELDRGRGPVATVLVQEGTLHIGDPFVVGQWSGRVRAMLDERGRPVTEAGPSQPVRVLGIGGGVPQAGDTFHAMASEQEAREIAQKRQQVRREQEAHRVKKLTLANIHERIQEGKMRELRLIVKGDVDGSVEALSDALMQLSNEEVRVLVIHRGVGGITESDVLLALASEAIIIGFNVRPDARAREVATTAVDIRLYRVIYEAIEDVNAALAGLLSPTVEEQVQGTVAVREVFHVPRAGTIAGSYVTSGAIRRNAQVRVLRDSVVVHDGKVGSLRRFKDDVREVLTGFECGVGIENFNDLKVGDVLEAYELIETARTL